MKPEAVAILQAIRGAGGDSVCAEKIVTGCNGNGGIDDVSNFIPHCNQLHADGYVSMQMENGIRLYSITEEGRKAIS
tara:strand:+ start:4944 stop:5174 length:231 start_codon:yes stop_codon:yes gene_type:complete